MKNKYFWLFYLLSASALGYGVEEAIRQQENHQSDVIMPQRYTISDFVKILKKMPTVLCRKKSLFSTAIEQGDLALVRFLTHFCSCNLNESYTSSAFDGQRSDLLPIEIALYRNHSPVLRFLLQNGAEVRPSSMDASNTLLHIAVEHGNLHSMRSLIYHGDQLDAENRTSRTPLHLAARAGHLEAVQLLWNFYKARLSDERIQELLIGREKKNDQDFFVPVTAEAVRSGSIEVTRFLIAQGAPVNSKFFNFLREALLGHHYAVFRFLVEQGAPLDSPSYSVLMWVCTSGMYNKLDMIKFLVTHGARLDTPFGNPLLQACEAGDLDLVRYLVLEKEVDVNAVVQAIDGRCFDKCISPIFAAADDTEIFFFMLKHGADVSTVCDGKTLMHYLAFYDGDHLEAVKILFKHDNSVIYALDDMKNSPLHLAAEEGNVSVARFLLDVMNPEKTQDLNSRNRTPLMCALWSVDSNRKCKDVIKYFAERFQVNGIQMTEPERSLFELKMGDSEGVGMEELPPEHAKGYA